MPPCATCARSFALGFDVAFSLYIPLRMPSRAPSGIAGISTGSFITVETNKLEKMGLVYKRRQTNDKRMVSLSLTPQGNELLDSIAPLRQQVNNLQFGTLPADLTRRNMDMFAHHVLPHLQNKPAVAAAISSR